MTEIYGGGRAATRVVGDSDVIPVTLVVDTSIYADNDVLAIPLEVTDFFRTKGGIVTLQSLVLLDEDDEGVDIDVLFLNADGSIGNLNAAYAPADAVARTIIGAVSITSSDYVDNANSQLAHKENIGLVMKGASDTTSVWVAAVLRSGTPTFAAASNLSLKLGIFRD